MALNHGPMAALPAQGLQSWARGWQAQVGAVLLFILRQSVNYRGEIGAPFYKAITAWILAENKSLCLGFRQ